MPPSDTLAAATVDRWTPGRRDVLTAAAAGVTTALAGCAGQLTADQAGDRAGASTSGDPPGELALSASEANVGQRLTAEGRGLPSDTAVALVWQGWEGRWDVVTYSEIVGPQYAPRTEVLASASTGNGADVSMDFTVPEAYGGRHPVQLLTDDGRLLAETSLKVEPTFELDRQSAPLGSQFTITGRGIGHSRYRRNNQVIWDNGFTGLLTGVTGRGTARARVTAAGPPGTHILEVGGGYGGISYLNPQQSPYPRDFRYAAWAVEVTEPADGDRQWRRPVLDESPIAGFYPDLDRPQGTLEVTPASGPIRAEATIEGDGLPADESVALEWVTMTGNRVSGSGYERTSEPLTTVETNGHGRFNTAVDVPDDLGGTHPIVAVVGDESVAIGGYVIQPSIESFGPSKGPKGTAIDIHLKGVGWTAYDNTYAFVYNNNYVGYACGFNTNGDVQVQLRASGQPGQQSIDVYPALYKKPNEDRETDMYMRPHLTYLDDHPMRTLPAMHFTFELTE